jgi:plastocyanin
MVVMLGWTAAAVGSHEDQVKVKDDCDPATFNAAVGPGTCVGKGKTTFQSFVAQIQANGVKANRTVKGWKFAPGKLEIDPGQSFTAVSKGGEFHTFSEVKNYGGGCVAFLNNLLGLTPVPECQPLGANGQPAIFATTGVPAGGTLDVSGLAPGLHHFECLIHPWMRTDVVVEQDDQDDDD